MAGPFALASDVKAALLARVALPPTAGTDGQVLVKQSSSSTGTAWAAAPTGSGSGSSPDASTTTKGLIRLAGHLAGTADSPQLATIFSATQVVGSSTAIPKLTIDAFGRVIAIDTAAPAAGGGGSTGMQNPMTSTGDLIVGGTAGAPTRLIGSPTAAKRFLQATGSGTAPGTPTWGTISTADVAGLSAMQTQYVGVNAQTGASYTPSLGDAGKLVTMGSSSANTFIVPLNSSVAYPIGSWIDVAQYGGGATSLGFATGVTLRSRGNILTLLGQFGLVRLIKINTNEWIVTGDLAAATTGGGDQGGGTTNPGTGGGGTGGTDTTVTNRIATVSIQNASSAAEFTGAAGTVALDSAVAKSGGSSIKFTPDGSGAYGYIAGATPSKWAPVTPGQTYTGFASVRLDTNVSAAFQCYLGWYDASGAQLGIANADGPVTGVQNNFVQPTSTGVAPANAAYAVPVIEYGGSGDVMVAANTIHVDEFGVNAGTSKTWTTGQQSTAPSPASITDTGFTYNGAGWQSISGEHYTSTPGDTASITFTLNTSATVTILGHKDPTNGTFSVSVDGGSAVTVSEQQTTSQQQAPVWSATLGAGVHTVLATCISPDMSIQGATVTNGTFAAPTTGGNTGGGTGGGGTTVGNNTYKTSGQTGSILGGATKSNGSGLLPPTADAFPGYTNILIEDFDTPFAEGTQLGQVLPRWDGYQGQEDGNVQGLYWDTRQISAAGSVVTMRNSDTVNHAQALTPIFRDSINVNKPWNQQAMAYGKTIIRLKSRGQQGYKIAFLLWPTDGDWAKGEIDYPEGDLISASASQPWTMTSASHQIGSNMANMDFKDSGVAIDDGKWHTATIEWEPNSIKFWMDGVNYHTVTDRNFLPTSTMRWMLQCETTGQGIAGRTAYVDIDWVAAYKKG